MRHSLLPSLFGLVIAAMASRLAYAQGEPEPLPSAEDLPVAPPAVAPPPEEPAAPIAETAQTPAPRAAPPELPPAEEPPMSEGRMLVSAYNSGFQWGIAPGVVFSRGKTAFAIGLGFGYGVDTGSVIVVPGLRLSAYFTDPNVYIGMPTIKLVLPLDRFAPFLETGAGLGHVADPAKNGAALMAGVGFMIHFRHVAFGAEASYQTITGTRFKGFGVGPLLAIGF